jgi:hypothetical protein
VKAFETILFKKMTGKIVGNLKTLNALMRVIL